MKCSKCQYYSYKVHRCLDGKINPKTVAQGVSAASMMGVDYICSIDQENADKKSKIVKEIYK